MESPKHPETGTTKWLKPSAGLVKLNWDATIDIGRQKMGIGIIVRDHTSSVLAVVSASRPHVTDLATAEAIATWKTTKVCTLMGFQKVILEGDSLEVVKALQGDGCCWSRFGTMINDAKIIFNNLQEWQVCHTKYMAKTPVHLLAKHGLTVFDDHLWQDDFPSCIH
jgi:hypothetical protein